jgi:hypothetical protein
LGRLLAVGFFGDPRLLPFGGKAQVRAVALSRFAPILSPVSRCAAPVVGSGGPCTKKGLVCLSLQIATDQKIIRRGAKAVFPTGKLFLKVRLTLLAGQVKIQERGDPGIRVKAVLELG